MMGVLFNLGACLLIVAVTVVPVNCQVDCPMFNVSELGATDMLTQGGLIGNALAAVSGDPSLVSVQVHNSSIVCLRSGRTRDTYSMVSVIVNYTCTGAPSVCTGNPTLSQFEFECVTGLVSWAASVGGSASNIITTPPNGTLSTPLRTDCGVCISPARSGFAAITNNEHHCGPCNSACNTTQPSLMRCFDRLNSGCCNFFENDMCVESCTSPLVPNSRFDCVVDCGSLTTTNGMLSYNPQGQDQTLKGATVNYTCNTGYTLNGNNTRACQANGAWTGSDPSCDDTDECMTGTPCQNRGVCNNTEGSFTCTCPMGYTGAVCDMDINECMTSTPCQNGGTCNNTQGNFTCMCPMGYTGAVCDMDIDECMTGTPCQNGGTCNNTEGSFACMCPMGYTGAVCDMDVDECMTGTPCQNGGTCNNTQGSFTCTCPMGYTGAVCDMDIDDCSSNPCQNGGSCLDGVNNFTCTCAENWVGSTCNMCQQGYTLNRSTCVLMCTVMFCANCSEAEVCEVCEPGFTLDTNGNCVEGSTTSESGDIGRLVGIILGCILGALLLLLFFTVLVVSVVYYWRRRVTSRYSLASVNKFESHDAMLNPVYIPLDALEEVDVRKTIEDDDEITVNKGALDADPDDAS